MTTQSIQQGCATELTHTQKAMKASVIARTRPALESREATGSVVRRVGFARAMAHSRPHVEPKGASACFPAR